MRRKLMGLTLGSFAALAFGGPAEAACPKLPGDLDLNGKVDVVDIQCGIVTSLWALAGGAGAAPDCLIAGKAAADLDCGGDVTVVDITMVVNVTLGKPMAAAVDADGNGCADACQEATSTCGGACGLSDGCCPAGCYATTDSDCVLDCTDASTWPPAWVEAENQILALTNQQRAKGATCGTTVYPPVAPLAANTKLRQAARCHSVDMALNGYFSHTGLDGSTPWVRIKATGYLAKMTGENIAAGYSTAATTVAGWVASPGHCTNMMHPSFVDLGVGYFYKGGTTYKHYWTQNFGTP